MEPYICLIDAAHIKHARELSRGVWDWQCDSIFARLNSRHPHANTIVAFDLDHTIIRPLSGNKFPKDHEDMTWWHEMVPCSLQALDAMGVRIVILSNQKHRDRTNEDASLFFQKIEKIEQNCGVPFDFVCSIKDDVFRKPRPGMWDWMLATIPVDHAIEPRHYLYVGDAAGRPSDFADTDYKFALNAGIAFQTPEQYFLKENLHVSPPQLHPNSWKLNSLVQQALPSYPVPSDTQEILVLVGLPASGKSTVARYLVETAGYVRINADEMGTAYRCKTIAEQALALGKSVIIDNTNMTMAQRQPWHSLASAWKLPCRCVVLNMNKKVCGAMAWMRLMDQTTPKEDKRVIKEVVFHTLAKRFEEPTIEQEGFVEVVHLPFQLTLPDNLFRRRVYDLYLS